jgi:hypothetical protein
MPIRYQIEVAMTIALAFYALAFFWTRWYYGWKIHVSFAVLGFIFDMYATYLMVDLTWGALFEASFMLQIHFVCSVLAITMFVIQGSLGLAILRGRPFVRRMEYRVDHKKFATKVFFPMWALSYSTGLLLAIF